MKEGHRTQGEGGVSKKESEKERRSARESVTALKPDRPGEQRG